MLRLWHALAILFRSRDPELAAYELMVMALAPLDTRARTRVLSLAWARYLNNVQSFTAAQGAKVKES